MRLRKYSAAAALALACSFATTGAVPAAATPATEAAGLKCSVTATDYGDGKTAYGIAIGKCNKTTAITMTGYMTMDGKVVGKGVSERVHPGKELNITHPRVKNPKGKQKFCFAAFINAKDKPMDRDGSCGVW